MNRQAKRTLLFLSAVLLSACVSERDSLIQRGYPTAYADGYDDGCHSGHKAGGNLFEQFRKDVRRFGPDRDYSQGWSDGYRQCETEQENQLRQQRIAIEQQRLIDQRRRDDRDAQRTMEAEALRSVDTSGLKNLK